MYYVIGVYCGNWRTRAPKRGEPKPKAIARGIYRSRKLATRHAQALEYHYNDPNVIFEALECDAAERRYDLSV